MNDKHKPCVVFLIGPPGSGKSTWIKHYMISAQHSKQVPVIIDTDSKVEEWGKARGLTYTQAFHHPEVNFTVFEHEMWAEYTAALANGRDIIIDRTNMSRKRRENFLKLIPEGYTKRAIIFNVPRDILDARLAARHSETGKYIPKSVVDNMIASYVEPTKDEFDSILKV